MSKVELTRLPKTPGVYLFKDISGKIIYVGAASDLKRRVSSYFQKEHDNAKTRKLVSKIESLDYQIVDSIEGAFLLERELIRKYRPRYNIQWVDDKEYPRLKITTSEEIPRILIIREEENGRDEYFGKRYNSYQLQRSVQAIRKAFGICGCKKPVKIKSNRRPCLDYNIGLCLAPCSQKIAIEDYKKRVNDLLNILHGKETDLLKLWEAEMQELADNEKFEAATILRDRIKSIDLIARNLRGEITRDYDIMLIERGDMQDFCAIYMIQNGQIVAENIRTFSQMSEIETSIIMEEYVKDYYLHERQLPQKLLLTYEIQNLDLISEWLSKRGCNITNTEFSDKERQLITLCTLKFRKDSERIRSKYKNKKDLQNVLLQIKKELKLPQLPTRIECFDISIIQGKFAVGSMVTFVEGKPKKDNYRKFLIKEENYHNDDVKMMKEVFFRRYSKNDLPSPDLILVDGGKAQVNGVVQIKEQLNLKIPVCGIAKKEELIYKEEETEPIRIPSDSQALFLLQRIRDEAHRFAITYHRQKRDKIRSKLDEIPGIGENRKKALLKHFGSVNNITNASIEEIAEVDGISRKQAEIIYLHLRIKDEGENGEDKYQFTVE